MTVQEQVALDRALSSATIALRFTGYALRQLPQESPSVLRAMLNDAQAELGTAVDALEVEAK